MQCQKMLSAELTNPGRCLQACAANAHQLCCRVGAAQQCKWQREHGAADVSACDCQQNDQLCCEPGRDRGLVRYVACIYKGATAVCRSLSNVDLSTASTSCPNLSVMRHAFGQTVMSSANVSCTGMYEGTGSSSSGRDQPKKLDIVAVSAHHVHPLTCIVKHIHLCGKDV